MRKREKAVLKNKTTRKHRYRKAVALMGSGLRPELAAKAAGVAKGTAYMLQKEINTDQELKEIYERSQRESINTLIDTSKLAVKAIRKGLQADKVPLHHAAAALREVTNVAEKIHARVSPQASTILPEIKDPKILLELLKLAAKEEKLTTLERIQDD